MITWKHAILTLAFAGLIASVTASYENQHSNTQTILDTTVALNQQGDFEGQFDTLIAAIQNSDISVAETLNDSEQNLTVFAPTDDAFSEIGINPDNVGELSQEDLTNILLYHVSEERKMYNDIAGQDSLRTLYGTDIMVREDLLIDQTGDEASIIVANVYASNGYIHAIDSVLKPYSLE